ncbi:MAG: FKBP-type peptidyl-prolyl cis-trans isomerase [Prevotellaceae bacterium]|jgi:FKBP-type peptidyl-prolyl cis-trans isomerase SlyD|nr:FKBP-type peptidyl-prolyl cis-trans isomerase [Prevotellaceae bacterium]
MKISDNKMVSVVYDLFVPAVEGGKPELMESATAENPLIFLSGVGMMLPMFEKQLTGLSAGDKFEFTLSSEDAYGERSEDNVIELPKNIFEIDGKFDDETIFAGNIVPLMSSEGERFNAEVVKVGDNTVTVDLNHPLAGENLLFKGEVLSVHEPTEEEIKAFMGGGCGCGCSDCGDEQKSQCGCGDN